MSGIIGGAFYSGKYCFDGALKDFNAIVDNFLVFGINDIPELQPYWDKAFDIIKGNLKTLETIAYDLYSEKTLNEEYFEILYSSLPGSCKVIFANRDLHVT